MRIDQNEMLKNDVEKAIILFNDNPKKGINYLTNEDGLIEKKPVIIAEFLLTTPGLSKASIG